MRVLLAALALALSPSSAWARPRQADPLDARSVLHHPGLWSGEFETAREDLLRALEADPGSGLAADAITELKTRSAFCSRPVPATRWRALLQHIDDAHVRFGIARELHRASRRLRFSEAPLRLESDLFGDWFRQWRVLGPLGPVDHPLPLCASWAGASPELGLADSYPALREERRTWQPALRQPNQTYLKPGLFVTPKGLGFMVVQVRAPVGAARLELRTAAEDPFRAHWNGVQLIEMLRDTPLAVEKRFLFEVEVLEGWNTLLLALPLAEEPSISARLLDPAGRLLDIQELDATRPLATLTRGAAGTSRPSSAPAAGHGPWETLLEMRRMQRRSRADLALAVACPAPAEPLVHRSWLRLRYEALLGAGHLPQEVSRRLQMECEAELASQGPLPPFVHVQRVARMLSEDRPQEALEELEQVPGGWRGSADMHLLRSKVLRRLDGTGVLEMLELEALLEDEPRSDAALARLARLHEESGDPAAALRFAMAALAEDGADGAVLRRAMGLVAGAGGPSLELLRERITHWMEDEPGSFEALERMRQLLVLMGDEERLEAHLRASTERPAGQHSTRMRLAQFLISRARGAEALPLIESVLEHEPSAHALRRAAVALGAPDPAQEFFERYSSDGEAALAAAQGAPRDASVIEVLDAGMIYLFPDGGSHQRMHNISVAADRKGTEQLHQQPADPLTRLARVIKADGTILEPVEVNESWVMPALDPGDAVELVADRLTTGLHWAPPLLGGWRFASFERPFLLSRYVVFVPDGLESELRSFNFSGRHEQERYAGGTVHILTSTGRARQPEEFARPSYEEILPWCQIGADVFDGRRAALWSQLLPYWATLPADLQAEAQALVEERAIDLEGLALARSLWDLVNERVLEFSDSFEAGGVWSSRRGNPLCLYRVLLDLAGLQSEWGVLPRPFAQELDPAPTRAFAGRRGYALPVLRLAPDGPHAEPVWVLQPRQPGERFGAIAEQVTGARVVMLEREPPQELNLPSRQLADSWSLDLEVTYRLDATGNARVHGTVRMTHAEGPLLREQLSQLGAQQRAGAARNLLGRWVPGLDLESHEFVDLERKGAPFELRFEGLRPDFLEGAGDDRRARLGIPSIGLSGVLGPAERVWPLALRRSLRQRARVRVEHGELWEVVGQPQAFSEELGGLSYGLQVHTSPGALEVVRTFELRGLVLSPEEMPAFLARMGQCEREEARPLGLRAVP